MIRLVTFPFRLYRWCLSPVLGCRCRFTPSCSHYAEEALLRHGLARGTLLTVRRLLRCNPFGSSGYDPVPFLHEGAKRLGPLRAAAPAALEPKLK